MTTTHTGFGRVTVYGGDVMRPPLCDSGDAQMVVIRNAADEPIILLARLNGDVWGLSTPEDKDWSSLCIRFGLLQPRSIESTLSGTH